ncbi:MAG: hypothetical protein AB4040_06945, partial [Synechococcus sp.]
GMLLASRTVLILNRPLRTVAGLPCSVERSVVAVLDWSGSRGTHSIPGTRKLLSGYEKRYGSSRGNTFGQA